MESLADPINLRLLDEWQRDFPLETHPFASIGKMLGCSEGEILMRLRAHSEAGRISRVGATCAPNTVSASTLAAVAAPADQVDRVAGIIGQQPGINHSYLRENHWNIWFVATGPDRDHINMVLSEIEHQTGLRVLDAPLLRPFNIDLGFRMTGGGGQPRKRREICTNAIRKGDHSLLQVLTQGMPLVERPYRDIAMMLGRSEHDIMDRITALCEAGIITRFGVIVRHRALGWNANAMVVWQMNPNHVEVAGPVLAAHPGVTLCYERRPDPEVWPYRLYCMIHAKSRDKAMGILAEAANFPNWQVFPSHPLFQSLFQTDRCTDQACQGDRRMTDKLDDTDRRLINRLQDDLPLKGRPFATVGAELGLSEEEVLERITRLRQTGFLTRFGPFYDAAALGGAFCLCAMAVPEPAFEGS